MKPRTATIAAAVVSVFPLLAICIVSIAHASPATVSQRAGGAAAGPAQLSVVGGQEATPGSFPWMAFIVNQQGDQGSLCSGTVLAAGVVLTAAHCVVDLKTGVTNEAAGFHVITGSVDLTSPERQVSDVSRVIPYPHFSLKAPSRGFGDAALLVLSTPTTAPAIPLATPAEARRLVRTGTHAFIVGWGETSFGQGEPSQYLLWAKTLIEGTRCEGLRGRVCASDFPKAASGVCHGDSGGPLLAKGRHGQGLVEIGIAQAVLGKCSTMRPGSSCAPI